MYVPQFYKILAFGPRAQLSAKIKQYYMGTILFCPHLLSKHFIGLHLLHDVTIQPAHLEGIPCIQGWAWNSKKNMANAAESHICLSLLKFIFKFLIFSEVFLNFTNLMSYIFRYFFQISWGKQPPIEELHPLRRQSFISVHPSPSSGAWTFPLMSIFSFNFCF